MPRDLVIGNGRLLVTFDDRYQIRDIYYPRIGLHNHADGHPFRFAVWAWDRCSWCQDDDWSRELLYTDRTLVTDVRLRNEALGLELRCADAVDFDRPIYLRRVTVHNLHDRDREVSLFFHHDFHLFRDGIGDTAYFDPLTHGLVHYKRDVNFMMNAAVGDAVGFTAFSTGSKEEGKFEGTWRDAEDGRLERNAIAQGSVDSTGGVTVQVPANGNAVVHYWMIAADEFFEALAHHDVVVERGAESFIERTRNFWQFWVTQDHTDLTALDHPIRDLYRRSMLIIRTQVDDGGAILAANDSDILQFGRDTYSYMWPRDGALVADTLIAASHRELAARFFEFCRRTIQPGGFMLHKYNPDETPGSSWHPWADADGERILPIQIDETALVLYALGRYAEQFGDAEFIKPLNAPLIKQAANFLVSFRHAGSGLPAASWDLWEERYGIHAFSVAAVWAGLRAATDFATGFGEASFALEFQTAADEIRAAALEHLYNQEHGRFVRTLEVGADGSLTPDLNIDASMCGLWRFGMVPADDPRIVATMEAVRDRLWVKTAVGGLARYENDYYHQVSKDIENVPGNPWLICTMWLAQWYVAIAESVADLEPAHDLIRWAVGRALPSGTLAEQVDPYSGRPLSVSPLTWSHSEFAWTVQRYVARRHELRG